LLQTDNEYRSEASLYAVVSSPMMVGTDIRAMTPVMTQCLLNDELIAINQDHLAPPGDQTTSCGNAAWVRNLTDGSVAVGVTNMDSKDKDVAVCFTDVGWTSGIANVRDIWANQSLANVNGSYARKIGSHDTLLVVLSAASPTPPPTPAPPTPPPPTPPPTPPTPAPAHCSVSLTKQLSKRGCDHAPTRLRPRRHSDKPGTFGCTDGTTTMYVAGGCRGVFSCDGVDGIECNSEGEEHITCNCSAAVVKA
jgi:hypothetical protein